MKLITRDTDYAVRAICFIAAQKDLVSATQLVKELNFPRPFLRKLLQKLNKEGVLKSYKGLGGGFMLAKPAERIFLTDLIRIFQGDFSLNECIFKKKICPNKRNCPLRAKISGIERLVAERLSSINIGELIRG